MDIIGKIKQVFRRRSTPGDAAQPHETAQPSAGGPTAIGHKPGPPAGGPHGHDTDQMGP